MIENSSEISFRVEFVGQIEARKGERQAENDNLREHYYGQSERD